MKTHAIALPLVAYSCHKSRVSVRQLLFARYIFTYQIFHIDAARFERMLEGAEAVEQPKTHMIKSSYLLLPAFRSKALCCLSSTRRAVEFIFPIYA
jgi:hypothetical protein